MADQINPSHYKGFSNGAQVIDIVERLNFNRGNAIKYIARAGRKEGADTLTDLEKGKWYLQREIDRIVVDGKETAVTKDVPIYGGIRTLKVQVVLEAVVCDHCDTYLGIPLDFDGLPFHCPRGHRNNPRVFERAGIAEGAS